MLNQTHRIINIKDNSVQRFYETKDRYLRAIKLRKLINKHNVSPGIIRFDHKRHIIEEKKLTKKLPTAALNKKRIQEIATLLKNLHSIKLSKDFQREFADKYTKELEYKPMDIFSAIFDHLPRKSKEEYGKYAEFVKGISELIKDARPSLSLIHGDVGQHNLFLVGDDLSLIDWDDARLDLPLVDIYCFFHSYRLNQKQEKFFWQAYGVPTYWNKDVDSFFKLIHEMFDNASEEVALIVPTYNRSPHKQVMLNPLYTTIESFLENNDKTNIVKTVIISDDASTDYTGETVDKLKDRFNKINFVYLRNKKRRKASYTRQKAIERCPSQLLFMIDDDCIFPDSFVFDAYNLFKRARSIDRNIAILNFPYVNKSFDFNGEIDLSEYCKVDYKNHWVFHNLDKYPKGVKEEFIKVDTLEGIFLGVKDKILNAGGYEDLRDFLVDYAEHISITKRITDTGYNIYSAIGKKYLVTHLKYGDFDPNLDLSGVPEKYVLILKRANQKVGNTGDRVSGLETLESLISSFTYFYFTFSEKEGKKHIKKELDFLIRGNNLNTETMEAYKKGINCALNAAKKRGLIREKEGFQEYMNKCISDLQSWKLDA